MRKDGLGGSLGSAVSMTATHLRGRRKNAERQAKTCMTSDLSQRDRLTFRFHVARLSTVTMETWTMSLDLLCKMANFTRLPCFC